MDTAFMTPHGVYPFETRCEMLAELGYDATYITLFEEPDWADTKKLSTVSSRYGITTAGVYSVLDIASPSTDAKAKRIVDLVGRIEACRTIELSLTCSDPQAAGSHIKNDDMAKQWLDRLLASAEQNSVSILLYPHFSFWLERIEDAVRLCQHYDHPLLRATFCGYHWYVVDGHDVGERIRSAMPYIVQANVCGSRKRPDGTATLEPLDEGEVDNFHILGCLWNSGFTGMVGAQGYAVAGDVYTKLRRSRDTFLDMQRRYLQHPNWVHMR
jgi:sugar phosphate isomerase/epimerase